MMINLEKLLENYDDLHRQALDATGFWGKQGAGCIVMAKDTGRLLIAHRSAHVEQPNTWGTWGGAIDPGENPKQAAGREVKEEMGYHGRIAPIAMYVFKSGTFQYHNFLVIVDTEFEPELNWENQGYEWVEFGDWPEPMHFGLKSFLENSGQEIKKYVEASDAHKKEKVTEMDAQPAQPPAIVRPTVAAINNVSKIANEETLKNSYLLAATIWKEARGEGTTGMQAVLNVIMNRAGGKFSKADEVVMKPYQFAVWNNSKDPDGDAQDLAQKARNGKLAKADDDAYLAAIQLVDLARQGKLKDVTGGATFYINPKHANPSWLKKMTKTKKIGNHQFYKPTK